MVRVASSTPQSRHNSALHALRRLSTIASALGHQEERIPDDVSTRGDVDACSRASRAINRIYLEKHASNKVQRACIEGASDNYVVSKTFKLDAFIYK